MSNKKVIFLSHTINEHTPLYGGDRSITLRQVKSIKRGDFCNTMYFSFPNHTGTHVDAPLHFLEKSLSISDFDAGFWIFDKVTLVEVSNVKPGYIIEPENINNIKDCELLLIKTGFEKYRAKEIYWQNSPGLHPKLAYWLKEKSPSLKAIGIDFISISNLTNRALGKQAHIAFLSKNILLIEDMKLSCINGNLKKVIVLPLRVEGADGAPCTVIGIISS